jgi:hypothetical protein
MLISGILMSYIVLSGFLVSTIMPTDSLQSTIMPGDIGPITILLSVILINVNAPGQLVLDLSEDVFRLNQFPFNFGNLLKLKIPLKPD